MKTRVGGDPNYLVYHGKFVILPFEYSNPQVSPGSPIKSFLLINKRLFLYLKEVVGSLEMTLRDYL